MEENKTIFNYLGQIFTTFGIIVLMFVILGSLMNEEIGQYSSLFELGKKGLSMSTLLQLFVLAMIISVGQIIFFTDRWIKNMVLVVRIICFFAVIIFTMVFFCCAFSWFPISDVKAWIGFIVSFSVCTSIGIVVCRMKEKAENKKMAQALQTIKSGESEYED